MFGHMHKFIDVSFGLEGMKLKKKILSSNSTSYNFFTWIWILYQSSHIWLEKMSIFKAFIKPIIFKGGDHLVGHTKA